jgi:protein-L-isoaspartate(D-aspartate) O-methyltransferase
MRNNNELIRHLIDNGRLKSPEIIAAFKAIDRKDFVAPDGIGWAYEDHALSIGHRATISQPSTVAFMLEKLGAQLGDKVLDVGAGSGWTTALLAHIVGGKGSVYGVEIIPALVAFGQNNLAKYALPNASLLQASEIVGLPEEAPFDKILVSASAQELPSELIDQLAIGGTLVIPVQEAIWQVTKTSEIERTIQQYPGFLFVPLQE